MSSINRKLANLITSTGDVASSALDNAASMQVFSSLTHYLLLVYQPEIKL